MYKRVFSRVWCCFFVMKTKWQFRSRMNKHSRQLKMQCGNTACAVWKWQNFKNVLQSAHFKIYYFIKLFFHFAFKMPLILSYFNSTLKISVFYHYMQIWNNLILILKLSYICQMFDYIRYINLIDSINKMILTQTIATAQRLSRWIDILTQASLPILN